VTPEPEHYPVMIKTGSVGPTEQMLNQMRWGTKVVLLDGSVETLWQSAEAQIAADEMAAKKIAQAPASHRRASPRGLFYLLSMAAVIAAGKKPGVLPVFRDGPGSRNCPGKKHRRKKFKGWQREMRRKAKRRRSSGRRKCK
jgi:hypothetical protein